jgi:hypothetical protein
MDAFQAFATQLFMFAMRAEDACQDAVYFAGALCILTTQVL